ncbi:MAG: hypothetical protein GEV03_24065 [Streptosporangiales bacterium]|nr:hypothetical protein [Streptosporangiales bacterium]
MRLLIVLALIGVALVHGVEGAVTHARSPGAAAATGHSGHGQEAAHGAVHRAAHGAAHEAAGEVAERVLDAAPPSLDGHAGRDPSRHAHKGADCLGLRAAVPFVALLGIVSTAAAPFRLTEPHVRHGGTTAAWKPRQQRFLLAELSVLRV